MTKRDKEIQQAAGKYIASIKKHLSNPVLRPDIKQYWAAQWDAVHVFLHQVGIETEQR